jgi:serine phosphatase RsbU (regulator of sigma subunit)
MITAFGSEEVAIDALRRGADDYLRKPVAPGEFEAVLQRTVARVGLRRHNAALQRQLDEKRRQLEVEVARAAAVQAELLPHAVPALAGFELAARCIPARDVGGDFYDWQMPTPGLLTLTLCDVMGKGMPAALMMATVRAVMRAVVRTSAPAVALQYIVAALDADLGRAEQFVTLFLAQLNIETHELTFVDAGHGHVLLRRSDGRVEALQPRGLPLGVLPDERYSEGRIVMKADDALIVYSDGLVDARPDLALTPHALAAQLRGSASAVDTVRRLVDLAALSGPPPDDLTIVVLWCQKMP